MIFFCFLSILLLFQRNNNLEADGNIGPITLGKLKEYGFNIIRLKTGTPQRIEKSSIDYSKTKVEYGDDRYWTFSFDNKIYYDKDKQIPCHLIYTTEITSRRNYRVGILKPRDKMGEKIAYFYKHNLVFYQNNEIGEIMANYIKDTDGVTI